MEPEPPTFTACSVADCGVKVPEKEPYFNYASFLENEHLLRSLQDQEIKELSSSFPYDTLPENLPTITSVQLEGKPVNGPVTTAGYNALRSDFDVEYDNRLEELLETPLTSLEVPSYSSKYDQELCTALQCAIVHMYNCRLMEREWRKRVVREHALIDSRKMYTVHQRLEVPFGKGNLMGLLKFLRFLTGPQLDYLIESFMNQIALRQKLNSYLSYRCQGIKFKSGIKIYENLNKKHLKNYNELLYNSVTLSNEIVGAPRTGRKPSAPLVLHNLPGYHLLDDDEKQLCSTARIVPETYHNFKQLLINECTRHNGIKLATARQVVKIDVNKTRKIFDMLMKKNLIWAPKS